MQDAMTAGTIQQIVNAYDQFAIAAVIGLLREGFAVDAVAAKAFEIADAMMVERKKRGLGGMP
jgi:hypothetical protein